MPNKYKIKMPKMPKKYKTKMPVNAVFPSSRTLQNFKNNKNNQKNKKNKEATIKN